MIPTFIDLRIGKTAKGIDMAVFWWTEGNSACDYERAEAFGDAVVEERETAMRKAHNDVCATPDIHIHSDLDGEQPGG